MSRGVSFGESLAGYAWEVSNVRAQSKDMSRGQGQEHWPEGFYTACVSYFYSLYRSNNQFGLLDLDFQMLYPWFKYSRVDLIQNIVASVFTGALEIC